jgi:hypothetical protein
MKGDIFLTNSFKKRGSYDIEHIKDIKIELLKKFTNSVILEIYPYYTQINNIGNVTMRSKIDKIRTICNKKEQEILDANSIEILDNIVITEYSIRKLYV